MNENYDLIGKYRILEEVIREIERYDVYGLDVSDMCLVLDVAIPPKFKILEFEKFKGLRCPRNRSVIFCRNMEPYVHNDKILIHYFQDSLSGTSLN